MTEPERTVVVVGAGVAGLTVAHQLARAGRRVLLVEKGGVVGGLARSYRYGEFQFDVGPHRFYSDVPRVSDYILNVLGDDHRLILRRSGVRMLGRTLDWPLRLESLLRLPPGLLLRSGLDLLRGSEGSGESFRDYVLESYGPTLSRVFFEPYTRKFLGISCGEVSRDWAVTGVQRAVIDARYRAGTLRELARTLLRPPPPLKFIYPASGGIGVFCAAQAALARTHGATVRTDTEVTGLVVEGGRVSAVRLGQDVVPCSQVVWTGPLTQAADMLGHAAQGLEHLDLLLFNYRVKHPPTLDYQWCYFGAEDVPFSRVSFPTAFNPVMAPPGQSGLCVEVTTRQGSAAWRDPLALEGGVRASLLQAGLVRSEGDMLGVDVERVASAYPIYTLDYRRRLDPVLERLEGVENLHLTGRLGRFWYNNMDQSIEVALQLADRLST